VKVPVTINVTGEYRVQCIRPDGSVRVDTGWFPNHIVVGGLAAIARMDWDRAQLGAGSTPPSSSDTNLESPVGQRGARLAGSEVRREASEPDYVARGAWFMQVPSYEGELREVGLFTSDGTLVSRALILDGDGNPTTVEALADDTLLVCYQIRQHVPRSNTLFTVVDAGQAGTQHQVMLTAASATSNVWCMTGRNLSAGTPVVRAWDGPLGTIEQLPSGVPKAATKVSRNPMYDGVSVVAEWDYNAGNYPDGIQSISVEDNTYRFQMEFDPPLPKTDDDILTFETLVSYQRTDV